MAILSTDPMDLRLDPLTGELVYEGGRLQLVAGGEAVAQGVRQRILNLKGEWFADLDSGLPWFENDSVPSAQAVIGGKPSELRLAALIRAAIVDTPGLKRIDRLSVNFDRATRRITVSWAATTEFGDTVADILTAGAA